jgi:hypothetical protein
VRTITLAAEGARPLVRAGAVAARLSAGRLRWLPATVLLALSLGFLLAFTY